jgi:two-component system, OmpR family, response regulator MprA
MPQRPATSDSGRVMIVEDDRAVAEAVARALRLAGYTITHRWEGGGVLEALEAEGFDAVILDVGLPGLDGLEVCRLVRTAGHRIPVLMLTARDAVADRVAGLDAGADDYLVKPFALDELLARVRALLRRLNQGAAERLRFGDVTLDLGAMVAMRGPRVIELTRTEWQLLELFMRNPGRVLTRSVIFSSVWGYDFGSSSHSLEVYVGYLRRKLEADGAPRLIQTVRGFGYRLDKA